MASLVAYDLASNLLLLLLTATSRCLHSPNRECLHLQLQCHLSGFRSLAQTEPQQSFLSKLSLLGTLPCMTAVAGQPYIGADIGA